MNSNGRHIDPARLIAAADQQAAMVMGMRVSVSSQILASLLPGEYHQQVAAAINDAYPHGAPPGESLDMSKVHINFNFSMPVKVAIGAAEMLLTEYGIVKQPAAT